MPHTPSLRRTGAILVTLLLSLLPALTTGPMTAAHADTGDPRADCLAAGKVWVYAIHEDTTVVADTCVDKFSTGTEALTSAGVKLTKDSKGFICSMSKHPATCPKTFNGQYWAYYHSSNGQTFNYASTGPDDHHPKAGSIEAWCYVSPGQKSCVPPALTTRPVGNSTPTKGEMTPTATAPAPTPSAAETPAADSSSETASGSSGTAWGVGIVVAIAVVAVAVVLLRRRGNRS